MPIENLTPILTAKIRNAILQERKRCTTLLLDAPWNHTDEETLKEIRSAELKALFEVTD